MNKVVAVLLALALTACASIQNPINTTRLAQIESAYGIALSAAVAYRTLYKINRCTAAKPESATNICARRTVVVALQQADRNAQISMNAARQFVRNNPNLDAGALIDAAQLAVGAFQQVEQQNGVH